MTMRIRFAYAVAGLCAAALVVASAQTPVRDGQPVVAPVGTASLAGVVRDADRQPVRRALVSIAGDIRLNRSTVTDDQGRFAFADLPAGRFTITASKAGYPPMSYGATRPYRTGSGVLLTDGQREERIELTLARGAVLTGTVFDGDGQPLPEVPVQAWEVRASLNGDRIFDMPPTGGETVTTDDRGRYRIFGLPPGDYTVGTAWFFRGVGFDVRVPTDAEIRAAFQAASQPVGSMPGGPPVAAKAGPEERYNYAPVYYPDAVDPLGAAVVSLGPGDERDGVDIRMQFRAMSRIEGTVTGPDGPAAQVRMVLFRRGRVRALNSTAFWSARSDGGFETASLAPGEYTIMAESRGGPADPRLWASADVTIAGSEPITVALTFQPAMTMAGRLVFEGTTLDPPDSSRVRVSLFAWEGTSSSSNMTTSPIDASGAFTIDGITPGQFRVNATTQNTARPGEPAWSVRSIVSGGRDVTDLPVTVTPAGAPPVVITFTDLVSELSGTITAAPGQAPSDFFVIVLPADRAYWNTASRRIVSARPDAAGRYIFRGLPAGEYRIAATTDLVSQDLQDTAALARLAGQSAPFTIALGEKKTFDLKIGG